MTETPPRATPTHDIQITVPLVRDLLDTQFPHYRDLPLTFAGRGWDNEMFRLGDELAVRLPRREAAAHLADTELDWLPRVSAEWTFAAPIPVAVGAPSDTYPWRWGVVPWIEGKRALGEPLNAAGAFDLGVALAQIHVPAPTGAPINEYRSVPLSQRRNRLTARLAAIDSHSGWQADAEAIYAAMAAASDAVDPWQGGIWCHLDLHGNNILTRQGRLAGIVDWGDAGAGDPATDLGQAWYLLGSECFAACVDGYESAGGAGNPRAPRVRAETIHYALGMASLEDPEYSESGWRALADLGVARRRDET